MKRNYSLMTIILLVLFIGFVSCSKEDEPEPVAYGEEEPQMFYVSIYENCDPLSPFAERVAENSFAYLFIDEGKDIDYDASHVSVNSIRRITYKNGTLSPAYIPATKCSIITTVYPTAIDASSNQFKDIPIGKYIIWTSHFAPNSVRSSSKRLEVSQNNDGIPPLIIKVFLDKDISGYREWGETW